MFRRIREFFNLSKHETQADPGSDSLSSDPLFNPSKHETQAEMFHELLSRSKRISRDAFADNFGGIADDVVEMLKSDKAQKTIQEARETMERSSPDSLRQIEFGSFNEAKELEKGEVAAIDGTFAFQCRSIQQDRQSALGLVASHIVGQC